MSNIQKKTYIADLHLHSKYSRAVSKNMTIPVLFEWGKKKGIQLIGTGDFTHPFWVHDLKDSLLLENNGFYRYNDDTDKSGPFFVLSSEISCIYSQGGETRKIHIVFLAPTIEIVEKINEKLSQVGNLVSDGRPILGITAEKLVEIMISISQDIIVIPAHIWTPWFSMFGSNSGFDSIEECFGSMSSYVTAVETGLSSDPAMNWRVPNLEKRQIVSFSDAHSPAKLGREATVIKGEFSYNGLQRVLQGNKDYDESVLYTIEFFPEEGKYYYTGHRNCRIRYDLADLGKKGRICPTCGKVLTVGVMQRVEDLATISEKELSLSDWNLPKTEVVGVQESLKKRPPYVFAIPLQEILAEAFRVGVSSKKVQQEYDRIIADIGSEFEVLLFLSEETLKKSIDPKIVEGIMKVREKKVQIDPGYDGVFGTVSIWPHSEQSADLAQEQITLF